MCVKHRGKVVMLMGDTNASNLIKVYSYQYY